MIALDEIPPEEESELIERCAEAVHKAYCVIHEKREGVPYWTNGDYSLLDESTKEIDRYTVRAVLAITRPPKHRRATSLTSAIIDGFLLVTMR